MSIHASPKQQRPLLSKHSKNNFKGVFEETTEGGYLSLRLVKAPFDKTETRKQSVKVMMKNKDINSEI